MKLWNGLSFIGSDCPLRRVSKLFVFDIPAAAFIKEPGGKLRVFFLGEPDFSFDSTADSCMLAITCISSEEPTFLSCLIFSSFLTLSLEPRCFFSFRGPLSYCSKSLLSSTLSTLVGEAAYEFFLAIMRRCLEGEAAPDRSGWV